MGATPSIEKFQKDVKSISLSTLIFQFGVFPVFQKDVKSISLSTSIIETQ